MRKTRLTAFFAVFLLAIASLAVAGCGSSDDETTGGGGGGGGGGEPLTVGSDIPYPPFEEGKAGNYTGFDVELLEAVGKSIGREVEFEDTSFDTIFLDLARGNFDVVARRRRSPTNARKRSTSPTRTTSPNRRSSSKKAAIST